MKRTSRKDFPIWEKIYLDLPTEENIFWSHCQALQIKQSVYIFASSHLEGNRLSFILDLETEIVKPLPLSIDGLFSPVWDGHKTIYLFKIDSSEFSDCRYSLYSFNIESQLLSLVNAKGVSPKMRGEKFPAFYSNGKIFFLGGMQIFSGDKTGSLIYSFNIAESEWNIESYTGELFPSISNINNMTLNSSITGNNPKQNVPYISNKSGMSSLVLNEKILIIGGKSLVPKSELVNIFTDEGCTNLNGDVLYSQFFESVESDEIFEYDTNTRHVSKRSYLKLVDEEVSFVNASAVMNPNTKEIYIHNKGVLYSLDNNEVSMVKPLLFSPCNSGDSNLVVYKDSLLFIGKAEHFDDCVVFKTCLDNLIGKWDCKKEISYEMLLNNRECSDIVFVLNAGDKNKEIHVNKKVMYNFSLPLKNILINYSQNSNYYNFNDVSFIGVYNTLKFIYSNFNDNITTYDPEILHEMIDIIVRYRAKSLLQIVLSYLKITNENALFLFDLSVKFNLGKEFKKRVYEYICENLNSIRQDKIDSGELKKMLFENFFCLHLVKISVQSQGFDLNNPNGVSLSQEKLTDIKTMCKGNKLLFCISCKKLVDEEQEN